ncbi:uncharacterized protein BDZ99DRAFT_193725 [Mytilinidion resinicola]|uniref:Secreted protein n=1 Tax=Mytilinidion resinicola TaxID=574789 RepID=A0A6A6Z4X7_9PEZI|nr:uncharacterized protein BDZ99DRAFT_193725 [Mytilinidion resinicola]KAF2815307.1 hypothetical protein BDZ99DRAFT_193725 [Mytilinidion resinicola]
MSLVLRVFPNHVAPWAILLCLHQVFCIEHRRTPNLPKAYPTQPSIISRFIHYHMPNPSPVIHDSNNGARVLLRDNTNKQPTKPGTRFHMSLIPP